VLVKRRGKRSLTILDRRELMSYQDKIASN
jgi:hypothetical protein